MIAIKSVEANEGKEIIENVHEITSPEQDKSEPIFLNNSSYREETKVTENYLSVNQYNICNLEIVLSSSSIDFLDFATSKIKNQINQVLEIEAPIKKNLLAKRVLAAWGISKLGSRIKAHFEMLLSQMEIKQTDKNEDVIFWNDTLNSENYEG